MKDENQSNLKPVNNIKITNINQNANIESTLIEKGLSQQLLKTCQKLSNKKIPLIK